MSSRTEVSRRELLTRAFRPRDAALATTSGLDEAESRRALAAPETAPEVPDWEGNLDRVLESLNDLSGIQEP
jgi:hypothetical protein